MESFVWCIQKCPTSVNRTPSCSPNPTSRTSLVNLTRIRGGTLRQIRIQVHPPHQVTVPCRHSPTTTRHPAAANVTPGLGDPMAGRPATEGLRAPPDRRRPQSPRLPLVTAETHDAPKDESGCREAGEGAFGRGGSLEEDHNVPVFLTSPPVSTSPPSAFTINHVADVFLRAGGGVSSVV